MPNDPLVSVRGERAAIPLPLRVAGRYLITGKALRGPGDNATFRHRATVDYRARPYIKLTGPLWQRLARRNGAITVPVLLTAASPTPWVDLWMVGAWEGALLLAAFTWACLRARKWKRYRRHHRDYIDPAARVLATLCKTRYTRTWGRRAILLPPGWGTGEATETSERLVARIHIPEGVALSKSLRASIESNVGARLGIPRPEAAWAPNDAYVELYAAPLPPKTVDVQALLAAAAAAPDDEIVIMKGHDGKWVTISLAEDSPHVLMSGAAGTGKSVLIRNFLVQRLLRGDGVIMTDPKRFSHWRWAGGGKLGQDRVIYAYRDEDLHNTWVAVGAETARRIELDEDELAGQRRVFVVAEELNAQIKRLQRYWTGLKKEREVAARALLAEAKELIKDSEGALTLEEAADAVGLDLGELSLPGQSPAVVALQETVFMGRELKMHMVAAAQRASANVFGGGGGDVRESFQGGRLVAKWDRKLWKMLVDTLDYVACPPGPRGIWGLAKGDDFHIGRVPFMSEELATRLVSEAPAVHGPVLGQQGGPGQVDSTVIRTQLVQAVKLSDAVGQLPPRRDGQPVTLDSLRRASTRPGFPVAIGQEGSAKTYDLADLEAWVSR